MFQVQSYNNQYIIIISNNILYVMHHDDHHLLQQLSFTQATSTPITHLLSMSSCHIIIMCHRCFNNQSICSAHCTHASIVLLYHQHTSDHTYTHTSASVAATPDRWCMLLLLLFHCLFECLLLRSSI